MTNEQAVYLLKKYVYKWSLDWDDDEGLCYCDAISLAIDALKEKVWNETLWHDAVTDPPHSPGQYYGAKDDTNSMWLCNYRDGKWTLNLYPEQEMKIVRWADYTAFN